MIKLARSKCHAEISNWTLKATREAGANYQGLFGFFLVFLRKIFFYGG